MAPAAYFSPLYVHRSVWVVKRPTFWWLTIVQTHAVVSFNSPPAAVSDRKPDPYTILLCRYSHSTQTCWRCYKVKYEYREIIITNSSICYCQKLFWRKNSCNNYVRFCFFNIRRMTNVPGVQIRPDSKCIEHWIRNIYLPNIMRTNLANILM